MSSKSSTMSLVRETRPATISLTYHYARETKGTWVYELRLPEGARSDGSNQFYLLKSSYPQRPTEVIQVTASFGK